MDGPPSLAAGAARPGAGGTSPVPLEMNDDLAAADGAGGAEGYTYPGVDPTTGFECLGAAHSKCRRRRRPESVDWSRASGAPKVVKGQLAKWLGVPAGTLPEQRCLCASCSDLFNDHRFGGGAKKLRFDPVLECTCCTKEKGVFGVPIPECRFEKHSACATMAGDAWRTEWSSQGLQWNLQVQGGERGCVHGFNKFLAGDGAEFPATGTNVAVSQYHTELIQDHCVSNPGLHGCDSLPQPSRSN